MDLETLFCSPDGFGIETASPIQRAKCHLWEGSPLGELAKDPDVRAAIGCDPSEVPSGQPFELLDIGPVGVGKTILGAANSVRLTQMIQVSMIKAGQEPPRLSVLCTHTDTARTFRGHLERVKESRVLRKLYIGDTDDSITLRHPTGLPLEIKIVAAYRGGYTLHSRRQGLVQFEEAPGWASTDRVVSLEDNRDTAMGRILPGGQIVYTGAPWQPAGWCYETWREHFGKPSRDLLVIHAREAWKQNPEYFTPERVEMLRRRSPRTFRMHVLGDFGGAEGVFDFDAVERIFRACDPKQVRPLGAPQLIIDPSSGKKDSWAFGFCQWLQPLPPRDAFIKTPFSTRSVDDDGNVVERMVGEYVLDPAYKGETRPFLRFFDIDGYEGSFWGQVSADEIIDRLARLCVHYGVRDVHSDQRESLMLKSAFERRRLRFHEHVYSPESKSSAIEHTRRWLKEAMLSVYDHPKLRAEFHAFTSRPTPGGGFTFGARGSGHDDYVALVLTAALASLEGLLHGSPIRIHAGHRNTGPQTSLERRSA